MSIHLTSLVWEINFPTNGQKLVALRLADYSNDDGASIFPSNDELARQCAMKKRGVQYILRGFCNAGLLSLAHEGGKGAKDTNRYQINVDLLVALALGEHGLEGAKEELTLVENKGAPSAPRTLARVHRIATRVHSVRDKGAPGCTQTTSNHQLEPSDARTRARPKIYLCKEDSSWTAWVDHLRLTEREALAEQAEQSGTLTTTSRWPTADGDVLEIGQKPIKLKEFGGSNG